MMEEIRKAIKKLKRNKSPGPDGLHSRIMKEVEQELAEPFKLIFNRSFTNSRLPTEWKTGHITVIFKEGKHTEPGNYRPISLTN